VIWEEKEQESLLINYGQGFEIEREMWAVI
jgi:hypothetical protein